MVDPKKESPGPAAYSPTVDVVKYASERTVFGTSDRETEEHRYLSDEHNKAQPPTDTPGPGTYRILQTKAAPRLAPSQHTNLPTWKFGSAAQRMDDWAGGGPEVPGPDNYNPAVKSGAPAYTFAPSDNKHGLSRNRDESGKLFISALHSEADKSWNETPGAGAYAQPELTNLSMNKKDPAYSFTKGKRGQERQFLSDSHMRADPALGTAKDTPGHVYEYPGLLDERGPVFGTGPRLYSPELGGNAGGPFISRLHAEACTGFEGQGPGAYQIHNPKDTPIIKFPQAIRDSIYEVNDGPGPGAYNPKAQKSSTHIQAAGYSVASNLRTDFTATAWRDNPGPGAYDMDGKTDVDSKRNKAPVYTLGGGVMGARDSFVSKIKTPGPGAYESEGMSAPVIKCTSPTKKGYSFGLRERTKHEKSTVSVRYHGPLASKEGQGTNSPGPCAYEVNPSRAVNRADDAPMYKFGRASRDVPRQFISKVHAEAAGAGMDSPGPGAYDNHTVPMVVSKHKAGAAFSFGTSQRPGMAKVRF